MRLLRKMSRTPIRDVPSNPTSMPALHRRNVPDCRRRWLLRKVFRLVIRVHSDPHIRHSGGRKSLLQKSAHIRGKASPPGKLVEDGICCDPSPLERHTRQRVRRLNAVANKLHSAATLALGYQGSGWGVAESAVPMRVPNHRRGTSCAGASRESDCVRKHVPDSDPGCALQSTSMPALHRRNVPNCRPMVDGGMRKCSAGACPPLGSGWGVAESTVPIQCTKPQLRVFIPWCAGASRDQRLL